MTNHDELAKRLEGCANFLKSIGNIYTATPIYAHHIEEAASALRSTAVGKDELLGVLTDVCQLIDGWHADVAWSEWDETVRWRVHCVMAKLDGREPLPRESFRRARAKVPEGYIEKAYEIVRELRADPATPALTIGGAEKVARALNALAAAPTPVEKNCAK